MLGHTNLLPNTTVYSWFTYCNPSQAKTFYASHSLDIVMIRPPASGIDNGAFVVSPDTVWYARVLLLFSAAAATDPGSKSFECALVSTLEIYYDSERLRMLIISIISLMSVMCIIYFTN